MNPAVAQLRQSFLFGIKQNPSLTRRSTEAGVLSEVVRFVHEAASVPANKPAPAGLGTSYSMFVELRHDSTIAPDDVLVCAGNGWRVGPVDLLKHERAVYGKRAPLTLVKLSDTKALISAKIGAVSGVIAGTNVTLTFPIGTDVSALNPVIGHNGLRYVPIGAQDFTHPVEYTITAQNLTTQKYTIQAVMA